VFNELRNDNALRDFIRDQCCENDVAVTISELIDPDDYVIIRVDEYYNSLGLAETPPSVDCLIIRRCADGTYRMTLVELKNIRDATRFRIKNIEAKFQTSLDDFITQRFRIIYNADCRELRLLFISKIKNYKRDLGLIRDTFMSLKFHYKGRRYLVTPMVPDPTIVPC
jgi:hypothetical protein